MPFLKLKERLTMDTSIADDAVTYALQGHTLPNLTPTQWLDIAKGVIDCFAPYMKYLPAVTDHRNVINELGSTCGGVIAAGGGRTSHIEVTYQMGAGGELRPPRRFLPLVTVSPWPYYDRLKTRPYWKNGQLTETFLLLTTRRRWVKCVRVSERSKVEGILEYQDTKSLAFTLLSDEEVLDLVDDRPFRWHMMIQTLMGLVAKAIAEKQKHIDQLSAVLGDVTQIMGRVEKPASRA